MRPPHREDLLHRGPLPSRAVPDPRLRLLLLHSRLLAVQDHLLARARPSCAVAPAPRRPAGPTAPALADGYETRAIGANAARRPGRGSRGRRSTGGSTMRVARRLFALLGLCAAGMPAGLAWADPAVAAGL